MELCWKPSAFHGKGAASRALRTPDAGTPQAARWSTVGSTRAFHGRAASRVLQAGGRSERWRRRISSPASPPWLRRFFVFSLQNDETYTERKEETNPKENILTKMGIPSMSQNGQPPHRGLLPPFISQGGREIQRGMCIPPFTLIRPLSYERVHPSNAARPPFSPGFCL